jgi:hypothetical protein
MPIENPRARQVSERLRGRRMAPGDLMFIAGEIADPGWTVLQLFRDDREALSEFGQRRRRQQHRAGGQRGYTMRNHEADRIKLCLEEMTPECFVWALVLIGETEGEVEPAQARTTCWQLRQLYDEGYQSVRWRDTPRLTRRAEHG